MGRKKAYKIMYILTPVVFLILSLFLSIEKIPNTMFIRVKDEIKSSYLLKVNERKDVSALAVGKVKDQPELNSKADVKLLGLFSVKSVDVKRVPDLSLYPGGTSIGVKLNTKGVLVVALSDIEVDNSKVSSPAAQSGIMVGDSILSINDKSVKNAEMLSDLINESEGKEVKIEVERKGESIIKLVKPVKIPKEKKYKIGLWVRDSTAGVGTLTFYDEKTGSFAALGHPITDVDTGTILNVDKGELVASSIVNIRKGVRGTPGELKGVFVNESNVLGQINSNTECGIFGKANKSILEGNKVKPMKVALRDEIQVGDAQIITTLDDKGPQYYDIKIEKLLDQDTPGPKSMVIKVTDPRLLAKTGGIVQGMSGSPIIQNNKIVGAVTHVLINKPDTGYGIYIEWMLKDSKIVD
ncbi:SpoIVB peptidase [Clostridium thermarum]|uniref:SpoIVB peptidase n=1 Tax=Clostridium thermarum TaxID=1716543 RepID=UPI00111E65E5|nr:SpoIVB peptidase [Clostridium thermarum]